MARRNRAKSSSLFLLELILAILFFSMASAVCVQFFVKSHLLSRNARELNTAVTEVSGTAELINVSGDIKSAAGVIQAEYPESETTGDSGIRIYYDGNFQPCAKQDAVYCLTAGFKEDKSMLLGELAMSRLEDDSVIYSLDISHHLQRRAGNGNE